MAAVTSLILVKSFKYRDNAAEEFSNRYYFRNTPPNTDAAWKQLSDDLIALEQDCFPPSVTYVHAYGYNDDAANAQSVWQHSYASDVTPPQGDILPSGNPTSGDQAAVLIWQTDRKNSRGKWIYLRKYFHASGVEVTDPDLVAGTFMTAYTNFCNALAPAQGAFYGGIRSRTHADNITTHGPRGYITTRTLKRRGKRPKAPA